MVRAVPLFLRDLRIEHTLFALPFAYAGAIFAARGLPGGAQLWWITLAVLGARTAAMAANRYFDRKLDALNPRTASRAVASGALPANVMLWAIAGGLGLLLYCAAELNPLCVKLLPLAAFGILVYPLCKRFTWSVHFVLGAVDALAPLGAFIAIRGGIDAAALFIFLAVTVWIAGFDIVYALMDYDFDAREGVRSLPVRFGERTGRRLPLALHALNAAFLAAAGVAGGAGFAYYLGVVLAVVLVVRERELLCGNANLFALNDRIFTLNMRFSMLFLATTFAGFVLR
jgi:4-hydroxybenzoate polyprenyltransferase